MDFHETWWKDEKWTKEEPIKSWCGFTFLNIARQGTRSVSYRQVRQPIIPFGQNEMIPARATDTSSVFNQRLLTNPTIKDNKLLFVHLRWCNWQEPDQFKQFQTAMCKIEDIVERCCRNAKKQLPSMDIK